MLFEGVNHGSSKPIAVDSAGRIQLGNRVPKGYQQLASITSSTALSVPATAKTAILQAEAANVRWRDDGEAPTASVGMLLENGACLIYDGALTALRFIQVSSGAILNVSYYE